MKYIFYLLVGSIICTAIVSSSASAHVLVTDETNSTGAVVHIIPDDDPVAGQTAELFFDIQQLDVRVETTKLSVQDQFGQTNQVPISVQNHTVVGQYVFASQGVYTLTLRVISNDVSYTFNYAQRVSRGTVNVTQPNTSHLWAEIVAIVSLSGMIGTSIIAFNRRQSISHYSQM
jgi:methionine-rich copper-binding protein CopC